MIQVPLFPRVEPSLDGSGVIRLVKILSHIARQDPHHQELVLLPTPEGGGLERGGGHKKRKDQERGEIRRGGVSGERSGEAVTQ